MDPPTFDPNILALQLLKPEGSLGEEVGVMMAKRHVQAMKFTLEQLNPQPCHHVLEIGFGPGEAIAEVAERTPKGFVAGIDFSRTMLDMATRRNTKGIAEKRVELRLGDAAYLPYKDNSFDAVFAMNVFHFWKRPQAELAECRRVLKSDGRVLFYVTHHSAWIDGLRDSGVFIAYEPSDVESILVEAGFFQVGSTMSVLNDRKCFLCWGSK